MPGAPGTEEQRTRVRAANRQLYDAVAERYEDLDGRRSPELEAWLGETLRGLRAQTPGGRLLDLGAGSGLVTRCARGVFETRVGCDISPCILAAHADAFDLAVAGDVDCLPFADASFDAITCFATLHHLYAFQGLAREAARLLSPGGVLYSDHDMDTSFFNRFALPLRLYRRLKNAGGRYVQGGQGVTHELYNTSEWRQNGVDAGELTDLLQNAGFEVVAHYHWYGLAPLTDRLFGRAPRGRGWAPLLSLLARKLDNSQGET